MFRKLFFSVILVLVVTITAQTHATTLFHWRFEGTEGNAIVSDTDIASGEVAYAFIDDDGAGSATGLFYGAGTPLFGGTSADFQNVPGDNDAGYGLAVLDGGTDSPIDLSTLTEVTIECFVQPYELRQSIAIRKNNSPGDGGIYYIDTRPAGLFAVRLAGPNDDIGDDGGICNDLPYVPDEWYHVALVWDGTVVKCFVDGVQSQDLSGSSEVAFTGPIGDSCKALGIGCQDRACMDDPNTPSNTGQMFHGKIDEVRISDVALDAGRFLIYGIDQDSAFSPDPKNKTTNLCDGITLCWGEGASFAEHHVYFGTDWDDVNDATTVSPQFIGTQEPNCYTPASLQLGTTYYWRIDEVNDANVWKGFVWEFTTNDGTAWAPSPADNETKIPLDGTLSWNPGCLAVSHDVYFGTDFNDVNDATTATAGIFQGNQGPNTFDPPGDFEFFDFYYWRIDEVGSGGSPVWKGKTWTFRSVGDIVDPNMIIWYTLDETEGEAAADGSGYENHAVVDGPGAGPDWDPNDGRFGGSLGFDDNTDIEVPRGAMASVSQGVTVALWLKDASRPGSDNWVFGVSGGGAEIKAAVVEENDDFVLWQSGNDTNDLIFWDLDGVDHATIEGWHHWAFVKNEVTGNMSIYFDGKVAESNDVVNTTIGGIGNSQLRFGVAEGHANDFIGRMDDIKVFDRGLTAKEVAGLFRGGELDLAWSPTPGDNAKDIPRDTALVWIPGDSAVEHDVYLGTDWDDVNDADTSSAVYIGRQGPNEYTPAVPLQLDTTYYWRIDEVNSADVNSPWKGNVWTFTVANYLIVDNMESYDPFVNRIWQKWDNPWGSGSFVELGVAPFAPVHTGTQSMEYLYDNVTKWDFFSYWSEAECNFETSQDWTDAGVKALTLFFYGDPSNDIGVTEQLSVGVEGTSRVDIGLPDMNNLLATEWHEWNIDLSEFAAATLTAIDTIYLRFGDSANTDTPGGDGIVYFDDIRLYPPKCVPEAGPAADISGNCIVDFADVGIIGEQWLRTDKNLAVSAPAANPIGHWTLDDGSGTVVLDSSTNGFDGTAETTGEGGFAWVTGFIGSSAMNFSGGRVIVPDNATLRPTSQVTAMAWINSEQSQGSARVLVKGPDNREAYELEASGETDMDFVVREDGNESSFVRHAVSSESLVLDEWIHIAGTYDGSVMKCFVNGVLEESETVGAFLISQDTNDLAIGNRSDADDRPFNGSIDDVRVYGVALTDAEVAYAATQGTGYVPLLSSANLYDGEAIGSKVVNFRDYAVLMNSWLEEKLWPE